MTSLNTTWLKCFFFKLYLILKIIYWDLVNLFVKKFWIRRGDRFFLFFFLPPLLTPLSLKRKEKKKLRGEGLRREGKRGIVFFFLNEKRFYIDAFICLPEIFFFERDKKREARLKGGGGGAKWKIGKNRRHTHTHTLKSNEGKFHIACLS